jgi:hypothetical protein
MTRQITVEEALSAGHSEQDLSTIAKHSYWREGDLGYLLHPGQLAARAMIREAITRGVDPLLNTARQWGKSRLLCAIAAEHCLSVPGARVPYAAPTSKQVDEFITPHWERMRADAPPELKPERKGDDWHFPNGSRVVISGCEDIKKADRLRGPRATMAIFDEMGFVPIAEYVARSVLGWQLATTGGVLLQSSTPPEQPDHPFVDYVARAQAARAYYHATVYDAPHITDAMRAILIERCGGVDTVAFMREGLAEILVDPQQVLLPEWADDVHVREWPRPDYYLPHVVGDLGYVDLTVVLFGLYDFERHVDVIEDELVVSHSRSDEIRAAVAKREAELWGERRVHRRRMDAPPIVRADLSREHDPEDPDQHWAAPRKDDLHAAVNALRVRLSPQPAKLVVHPRCLTTIAHARFARWNRQRTDFERPAGGGHHYDGAAALVYFHRELDRATNPFPIYAPGVTASSHHLRPVRTQDRKLVEAVLGRRR